MLPSPLPAVDHVRVVTTDQGDIYVTEKHRPPCVEYIARGILRPNVSCTLQFTIR